MSEGRGRSSQGKAFILAACLLSTGFVFVKSFKVEGIEDAYLEGEMLREATGVSRYPYIASLRAPSPNRISRHICGGVLVGPSHVLVAASCLVNKVVFNPEIHLGRAYPMMSEQWQRTQHAEIIQTEKVHFPPGYSITNSSSVNDLALIEMEHPSAYSPIVIPPAQIPISMVNKNPRLRSMGWAPTGFARDDFFMDVSVLQGNLEGPKRHGTSQGNAEESDRFLLWAKLKLPVAWCGQESGRLLVISSPVGHVHDGDVLVGMQSAEGPDMCKQSVDEVAGGVLAPRSMSFTSLAGPVSNLEWVRTIMAEHDRGLMTPVMPTRNSPEAVPKHEALDSGMQSTQGIVRDSGKPNWSTATDEDCIGGTSGDGEFQSLQLQGC